MKDKYGTEPCVSNLSRSQRSLVAQLTTGILPLALQVGTFKNIQENNSHLLLYCPHYDELRVSIFNEMGDGEAVISHLVTEDLDL